jgi:small GTP-binding protein
MSGPLPDGIPRDSRPALKVILTGNSGVGKTCLISAYQMQTFTRRTSQTIAPSYIRSVVQRKDGSSIVLQIWDTAGQERFMSISQLFFKDSHCALVCFDPSDPPSVLGAKDWVKRVTDEVPGCQLFGVLTKSDKHESAQVEMALQEAKTQLVDVGIEKFFVTSAVSRQGVQELFAEVAEVPAPGVALHVKSREEDESKCC